MNDVLTIGICDDVQAERDSLSLLVENYFQRIDQRAKLLSYGDGEALLSAASKGQAFDILILDVYMGTIDGLSVARRIREFDDGCCIFFATNSNSYAIKGYEVQALHYLLKPVDEEKIASALDRAMQVLKKRDKSVQVQNRQGSYRVSLGDIVYAESSARILTLHMRSGELLSYYDRLDNLERACGDSRFLRCHKSYLVNLDYVHSIANNKIQIEGEREIPISMSVAQAKELFAYHAAQSI
jgi:Response regulator of the LytR/AlgR family